MQFASAYPGIPSTEILETYALFPNVYAECASNEKVTLDVAVGAAYAGHRTVAARKHVGLNVAGDSFLYASRTGLEAGLVNISADDPGMHSTLYYLQNLLSGYSSANQVKLDVCRMGLIGCVEMSSMATHQQKFLIRVLCVFCQSSFTSFFSNAGKFTSFVIRRSQKQQLFL